MSKEVASSHQSGKTSPLVEVVFIKSTLEGTTELLHYLHPDGSSEQAKPTSIVHTSPTSNPTTSVGQKQLDSLNAYTHYEGWCA